MWIYFILILIYCYGFCFLHCCVLFLQCYVFYFLHCCGIVFIAVGFIFYIAMGFIFYIAVGFIFYIAVGFIVYIAVGFIVYCGFYFLYCCGFYFFTLLWLLCFTLLWVLPLIVGWGSLLQPTVFPRSALGSCASATLDAFLAHYHLVTCPAGSHGIQVDWWDVFISYIFLYMHLVFILAIYSVFKFSLKNSCKDCVTKIETCRSWVPIPF